MRSRNPGTNQQYLLGLARTGYKGDSPAGMHTTGLKAMERRGWVALGADGKYYTTDAGIDALRATPEHQLTERGREIVADHDGPEPRA